MQRICVDMDEVMADTLAENLRRYNEEFNERVTRDELTGKGLWEISPLDRHDRLRAYFDELDFFADLEVMPDSQAVLQDLSHRYDIFIASAAMVVPFSFDAKFRWLQRHFPFIPQTHYIFCGDKSILRADFLIDDLPRNIQNFVGQGLLYTSPHNLSATGYLRVNDWKEVAAYFANLPQTK